MTGKILGTHVHATDLSGLTAVITDDICDGGATFIGIAKELRRLNCHKVVLYVTHGIFSKGIEVLMDCLTSYLPRTVFTTTIRQNFSNCFCSRIKRTKMTIKLNPLNAIDFIKRITDVSIQQVQSTCTQILRRVHLDSLKCCLTLTIKWCSLGYKVLSNTFNRYVE